MTNANNAAEDVLAAAEAHSFAASAAKAAATKVAQWAKFGHFPQSVQDEANAAEAVAVAVAVDAAGFVMEAAAAVAAANA